MGGLLNHRTKSTTMMRAQAEPTAQRAMIAAEMLWVGCDGVDVAVAEELVDADAVLDIVCRFMNECGGVVKCAVGRIVVVGSALCEVVQWEVDSCVDE